MVEIFLSLILLIFLVFISGFILSTSLFKLNYNELEFYEKLASKKILELDNKKIKIINI